MIHEPQAASSAARSIEGGQATVTNSGKAIDQDAEQLRALGYVSHFDRTMSKWENFSLGFTYLSPVVGVYTIFATAFVAGGPPMWWTYIVRRPGAADGVPGLRRRSSRSFRSPAASTPGRAAWWASAGPGWPAGSMAGPCAAPWRAWPPVSRRFLRSCSGIAEHAASATTGIALVLIVMTTVLNLSGTRLLARVAMFGFICELVGAIVVGGYLLLFARHQPLKVLLDTSFVHTDGSLLAGISRLLARRHVLLLRLRGLRRRRRGDPGRRAA